MQITVYLLLAVPFVNSLLHPSTFNLTELEVKVQNLENNCMQKASCASLETKINNITQEMENERKLRHDLEAKLLEIEKNLTNGSTIPSAKPFGNDTLHQLQLLDNKIALLQQNVTLTETMVSSQYHQLYMSIRDIQHTMLPLNHSISSVQTSLASLRQSHAGTCHYHNFLSKKHKESARYVEYGILNKKRKGSFFRCNLP